MSDDPQASGIIPAYNAAAFIADAIGSGLGQNRPVQPIVVDDGSTDDTAQRAAAFGGAVELVSHGRNKGLPSALNSGLARARAGIIGFLDADDLWQAGRLEQELELLATTPAQGLWGMTGIEF